MSSPAENGEKSHEATPKKLQDARKEGTIPKSNDISTAASYLGLLISFTFIGTINLSKFASNMSAFLLFPERFSLHTLDPDKSVIFDHIANKIMSPIILIFITPAILVLLSLTVQRAILFSPSKIKPKMSKISPISSIKNKFGPSGLFEFGKSTVKLIAVSLLMIWFLANNLELVMQTTSLLPPQILATIGRQVTSFITIIFIMSLLVGSIDYMWQIADHMRKNRMSRKEIEDESKEAEGDPHHKQTRRQRAYEIAMNQMLSDVPEATVVIVNPTHFAVALKWDPLLEGIPICVAKGGDEIAARIREVAMQSSVPIHSDPPTARALFARIEIGEAIHPEDYQAVAAAIRFAQSMRKQANYQP